MRSNVTENQFGFMRRRSGKAYFSFRCDLDEISRGDSYSVSACMLFVDDIVLVIESKLEVNKSLARWLVAWKLKVCELVILRPNTYGPILGTHR